MDDVSIEYRVEREKKGSDTLIRAGGIAATVIFALLSFFVNAVFMLPAIGCIVACVVFFPRLNVEFEYLFVAGELSIDCIYAKKSRKNAANYPMNDVELISDEKNDRLSMYNNINRRVVDFSSGAEGAKRYVIVCRVNGGLDYAIVEPGEEIIEAIYDRYPNKCAK